MANNSKIEWCDATWNPIVGCSIQSKGCTNCYAMKQAARIELMTKGNTHYADTTKYVNGNAIWTGKVALAPQKILEQPLHWKKPRRIFVNSMGDLFHDNVDQNWIDKVFDIIALCPQHTFIILTKNPIKMQKYLTDIQTFEANNSDPVAYYGEKKKYYFEKGATKFPRKNVWLGVSVENQETANERIPLLLDTPAAVRFISAEPLLGPIHLDEYYKDEGDCWSTWINYLDWVIVGGESGKNARPMHPDWVRNLRNQCEHSSKTSFYFKQWGNWCPCAENDGGWWPTDSETCIRLDINGNKTDGGWPLQRIGKKSAGNTLDGAQHLEFPKIGGA